MKKRSPIFVILIGFVTFGFYSWYWAVKTKGEMNKLGEQIPTAWMWLIPVIGSVWWYWKYSEGVEHVTKEKLNWIMALVVLLLLGNIGQGIVQDFFNKVDYVAGSSNVPQAGQPPVAAFGPTPPPTNPMPPTQQPPTPPPSGTVVG